MSLMKRHIEKEFDALYSYQDLKNDGLSDDDVYVLWESFSKFTWNDFINGTYKQFFEEGGFKPEDVGSIGYLKHAVVLGIRVPGEHGSVNIEHYRVPVTPRGL